MNRKLQAFSLVRGAQFAVGVFVAVLISLSGEKDAAAQVQQFGDRGQLVITAENLFGFSTERVATSPSDDVTTSQTQTQFGLFYQGAMPTRRGPWVGAHYFVIPNLSIGATLGLQLGGSSNTGTNGATTTTNDGPSVFGFMLLPKVGYALMFNDMLGFWFRGGPGFVRASSSVDGNANNNNNDVSNAQSFWILSLDALFVVTPVHDFGFYLGPQGNLSFAGSYSSTRAGVTTSVDASFRSFSIDAGLFGYFDL
jgi:hypothetical protein